MGRNTSWTALVASSRFAFIAPSASPAIGADPRFIASLRRLDPDMRLEQICDYEAMNQIRLADRAKSYVISSPIHIGDTLKANGGAFRRNGRWFRVSFVCKAAPDHLSVLSFNYKIGAMIPQTNWQTYGLWD